MTLSREVSSVCATFSLFSLTSSVVVVTGASSVVE